MNKGLSEKLNLEFPDVNPITRPVIELPEIIDYNWIAGLQMLKDVFMQKLIILIQLKLEKL